MESLNDGWRRSPIGVEVDGSAPGVDDSAWPLVRISASWADQELLGYDGPLWYRQRVSFVPPEPAFPLGLLVGPLVHGRYELFADGESIGVFGSDPTAIPIPDDRVFPLPERIVADGEVLLSLSIDRVGWASDAEADGTAALGGVVFGALPILELVAENRTGRSREAALPTLLFALLALVVGGYHLLIFVSRPSDRPYLWFGIGSLLFGVNAIAFSPWTHGFIGTLDAANRVTAASGHLAAACLIAFLWGILDRPLSPLLRAYLASQIALAAVVLVVPLQWLPGSEILRFVWLIPFIAAALVLLVRESLAGRPDARLLLVGGVVLALAEILESGRVAGLPIPPSLPYLGFSILLLFVAGALADRYARAHAELDALRLGLEKRVTARTLDLERMSVEAQRASLAKSTLLSTLSHELRAPLKSITGFSSLLLTEPSSKLEEGQIDFLRRIRANGQYALTLVSNLLDLSRIEAGKLSIEAGEFDLGELVEEVRRSMEAQAVDQGVELTAQVPQGLAPFRSDALRLKQVLVNLVGNGVKFASGGSVTISVTATDGRAQAIEVSDSGIGIPEEMLEKILQPYEQGQELIAGRKDGAGLGLAISKSLCELLGCGLTITSRLGEGTTATISLAELG